VTRVTATARPMTPVRLKADWVRMGTWSTFPERVELLDLAYTSARRGRWGKRGPRLRPIRLR
jgi:hypothetical protein